MKKFGHLYEKLRSSFWSVPLVMILMALLLAWLMRTLDNLAALPLSDRQGWSLPSLLQIRDTESARALLSVIAGSTITVAGTVFSITMVALTLASNQYGPHLVRNFIRDRGTQVSLGIFLATFTYALVTMRVIGRSGGALGSYGFSVQFALLLTLASIGCLVYFIHNVAQSIQADNITQRVYSEFYQSINREYPETTDADKGQLFDVSRLKLGNNQMAVPTSRSGYVQFIDREKLISIARQYNCCIKIECHPGSFLHSWNDIGRIYQDQNNSPALSQSQVQSAILIGSLPTSEQDVVFCIQQLSQIAVRALSSGINDPFTAYSSVERLVEGLGKVLLRPELPNCFTDSSNQLRLISCRLEFSQLLSAALDEIIEHGHSNGVFILHLLNSLSNLTGICRRKKDKSALSDYLSRLSEDSDFYIKSASDLNAIKEKISDIQTRLTD
ncbi:DUF2254 domain-containing protein [Microbulbifer sp. GL-2]|uniref:DUF2254 domain-containing protein n=1 Tax=Microbulbifer sp. GL-2 TaxID=2591606 RepID=UPI00117CF61A|nr:DUF2254 domain-containing protein [Microbulbifer sp. GL-2]